MPLYLVSTPIGHPDDITLRALKVLREADVIIGEEGKEVRRLLKSLDIPFQNLGPVVPDAKPIELLNEHSTHDDIERLGKMCRDKNVALVTDCGTPGFCDPGADLVRFCQRSNIATTPIPGASSLMSLLAVTGARLDEFLFVGFLPANTAERERKLHELTKEKRPFVVMDTPYRLQKTLRELAEGFGHRDGVLGLNLTQDSEKVIRAPLKKITDLLPVEKAEFVLVVL
jgi:16S rRNA (cytidine1402-2'-O)-methyltransferase